MTRRAKHLALSYAIVLAGVGILLLFPDPQPTYRGKRLFDWISQYMLAVEIEDTDAEDEAIQAVRTIGTNAIPFLIDWLRKDRLSCRIERAISSWKNFVAFKIANSPDPATQGMFGFEILGRRANAALPELYRITTNSVQHGDSPYAASNARRAIGCIEDAGNLESP